MNLSKGIKLALITALISGVSVFYNKLVLVKGVDPLVLNILKNGGVALLLSLIVFRPVNFHSAVKQLKDNWKVLILLGLIGGSIPFILFFQGLKDTPALQAQLINKTLFIWTALLAVTFLKEKITPLQVIGYVLIIASNLVIGGLNDFTLSISSLMILVATLFWSLEAVIVRKYLKSNQALLFAWSRMFFGSIALISIAVYTGKIGLLSSVTEFQLIAILGSVVLLTGYVSTYYSALKFSPATIVTVILILATPVTNTLSAVFITKSIAPDQIATLLVTSIGVIIASGIVRKIKLPSIAR